MDNTTVRRIAEQRHQKDQGYFPIEERLPWDQDHPAVRQVYLREAEDEMKSAGERYHADIEAAFLAGVEAARRDSLTMRDPTPADDLWNASQTHRNLARPEFAGAKGGHERIWSIPDASGDPGFVP